MRRLIAACYVAKLLEQICGMRRGLLFDGIGSDGVVGVVTESGETLGIIIPSSLYVRGATYGHSLERNGPFMEL